MEVCARLRTQIAQVAVAAVVVLTAAALGVGISYAGGSADGPGNGLSVTNNAAASLLPDDQAAENSWLSGLHVSGYGSQTFGMWQNPTALRDFTPSRNNLSTSRSLLQVDENYRLNENNTFFMREWFVYEPPYSFNSANNTAYAGNGQASGQGACFALYGPSGCSHPASFGHFMNDWYNVYQVRDAWWENKTGPLSTFVGNQIVVWGQSLAFRVGDVINPVDTAWAFGFANLEQSRNAQWMIHPILNLPEIGPLTSNFIEGVWQPGFAPQWWECSYPDGRYNDHCQIDAGRAVTGAPAAMHGPSGRFDIHYDNSAVFGINAPLSAGPYGPAGAGLVAAPAAHEFWSCANLTGGVRAGFVPKGTPIIPCTLGLSKHNVPYGPTGNGATVDVGEWRIRGMQPQNWNNGLRFHSLYGATEFTILYYDDNMNGGAPGNLRWTPGTNLWTFDYPSIQRFGVTADQPLPIPASLSEYFPAVGRAEMLYTNHVSETDMRPTHLEGERYTDTVTWMTAVDLDQAYAPWLTSTGNLSANVEVYDNIIMDKAKTMSIGTDVSAPIEK
ncbi:MAG TPA: DUF1302 family protein, partial [Candidatus Binataceae bacterium]|nr:DUF1302 family protein [Candidatus Binataceae bacterium]